MAHQHEQKKYTCPKHAQIIQDKPGNCPICGMTLVLAGKEGNASDDSHHQHDHNPSIGMEGYNHPDHVG